MPKLELTPEVEAKILRCFKKGMSLNQIHNLGTSASLVDQVVKKYNIVFPKSGNKWRDRVK